MPNFLDHLKAEIAALERELLADPRFLKMRELRRVEALYEVPGAPDSLAPTAAPSPARRPATREISPETKQVIEETERFLAGRTDPVPLRELYHQVVDIRGCRIGGRDPINGLSAILSRAGKFRAHGRTGWTLRTFAPNVFITGGDGAKESESEAPSEDKSLGAPKTNDALPLNL